MQGDILSLALFATTCGVLLLGFPVAFSLAGTAFAFALLGAGLGVFDLHLLLSLPSAGSGSWSTRCWWRCRCSSSWA